MEFEAVTMFMQETSPNDYGGDSSTYPKVYLKFKSQMPGEFTSDDFRLLGLDKHLSGHEANRIGGFFRYLKTRKLAEPTGERVPTDRPRGHGRYITVWRWVK